MEIESFLSFKTFSMKNEADVLDTNDKRFRESFLVFCLQKNKINRFHKQRGRDY